MRIFACIFFIAVVPVVHAGGDINALDKECRSFSGFFTQQKGFKTIRGMKSGSVHMDIEKKGDDFYTICSSEGHKISKGKLISKIKNQSILYYIGTGQPPKARVTFSNGNAAETWLDKNKKVDLKKWLEDFNSNF